MGTKVSGRRKENRNEHLARRKRHRHRQLGPGRITGTVTVAVASSGAVSSSSSSPDPRTPVKRRPDGFGFSAAGMIFPYHVGAWEVLCEMGLLHRDTPVAGASAGALVAALHACGLTPADGRRILMGVLADCRENGVVGRVGHVLEDALRRELPADAHERCSRGNLHVSVTSPALLAGNPGWPLGPPRNTAVDAGVAAAPPRVGFNGGPLALDGELISDFADFDDLVGALLSSCHIPLYCGWPARSYRGKFRVDGGWTRLTPTPPGCEAPVRVASFPLLDAWRQAEEGDGVVNGNYFARQASFWEGWGASDEDGLLIAPDGAGGDAAVDYLTLGKWALLPAADDVLDGLVEMGRAVGRAVIFTIFLVILLVTFTLW